MPSKKLVDLTGPAHELVREVSHTSRASMKHITSAVLLKHLKPGVNKKAVQSMVKRYTS